MKVTLTLILIIHLIFVLMKNLNLQVWICMVQSRAIIPPTKMMDSNTASLLGLHVGYKRKQMQVIQTWIIMSSSLMKI
jgi:hypothetical protein